MRILMKQEPFQYREGMLHLAGWEDVTAGFTTREGGVSNGYFSSLNLGLHVGDEEAAVHENRRILASRLHFPLHTWICSEQVHDNKVERVGEAERGKGVFSYVDGVPGTDGIYTGESGVFLSSCYADCVPLYFYAPKRQLIGLAHAGWKGTAKGVAREMLRKWKQDEGVSPSDVLAAIGPSIGGCCYVVDDRVLEEMRQQLQGDVPHKVISKGQYALDLKEINRLIFLQEGIKEENIAVSSFCTSCEETLFFSHRRDQGKTGRMLSFIGFKEVLGS